MPTKLSKSELRLQQNKLNQLQRYLPTLQLKKALLQAEVQEARLEIEVCESHFRTIQNQLEQYAGLLTDQSALKLPQLLELSEMRKKYENIAGTEVPYLESVTFADWSYDFFEVPLWVDQAVLDLRRWKVARLRLELAWEKKSLLEKELNAVAIRVNLFEKVLIPRAQGHIKKIKLFLGDLQLAAVSQAKMAKKKVCATI